GGAVDGRGNLFVTTGNADSTTTFDGGNAVLRLTPDLTMADSFAPADFAQRSARDADLGSTGPVLLDGGLVFQVGKSGDAFLLRADRLGGVGGQAFTGEVCPGFG